MDRHCADRVGRKLMPLASGPNAPRGVGKFFRKFEGKEREEIQDDAFKQIQDRAEHGYPPTSRSLSLITRKRFDQIKDSLSPPARKAIENAFAKKAQT
jgi:hypothetical protein